MTLRKLIPASLLLLAACAAPAATPAETTSVGMDKAAKKDCCSKMTAEQKAECDKAGSHCCDKTDATKPNG